MKSTQALALAFSILLLSSSVHAAILVDVGAGNGIPNDELDGGGGRINVDLSNPINLAAGVYAATLFNYDAGVAGDVTPFLARDNGNNTYTAIAVGADQGIGGASLNQSVLFGGSAFFTLLAPTLVYAGIASDTQNPIFLDNGTGPFTDHEGGGQAASTYLVTVGGVVPGDGSFSNADLGRTYAFSVTVVPEPSTALLAAIGLVFACGFRRRR